MAMVTLPRLEWRTQPTYLIQSYGCGRRLKAWSNSQITSGEVVALSFPYNCAQRMELRLDELGLLCCLFTVPVLVLACLLGRYSGPTRIWYNPVLQNYNLVMYVSRASTQLPMTFGCKNNLLYSAQ